MSVEIGQKVRVALEVRNEAGVLTNATVTVAVTKPNLTAAAAPTAVNDGTGLYHFDVTPDAVPGPWGWTATTSGTVVSVRRGSFWVREPGLQLIPLDDIKAHLNKDIAIHDDDDELLDWIDAARYVIEREIGPVLPRTVMETHWHNTATPYAGIHLRQGPVISVTSVTERWGVGDSRTLAAWNDVANGDNEYWLDDARTIRRVANGNRATFGQQVTVTYVAGRYPVPTNAKMAVAELISHLWRASQLASGATRPNLNAPDTVQLGYAVPNRVRELLGRRRAPRLGG